MSTSRALLVAAIDFGTTYSGYAFSFYGEYTKNPLKIQCNQAWRSGGKSLLSLKTPTTLLLDKDGNFVSFGYEAENKYMNLVMDGEHENFLYFQRFKMSLHNVKGLSADLMLEDIAGKPLSALTVFSQSIKALKDHLIEMVSRQGKLIKDEEIAWVLTVPAIWDDAAKQFMRCCGEKAGINKDQLKIALEPEAASIYCQHLPTERLSGTSFAESKPGTKYMIVDLGGGTADITVHEKLEGGKLKELHKAGGGACGGTAVDRQFLKILEEIFGNTFMTKLRQDKGSVTAYIDLMREFESLKRNVEPGSTGKLNITIPYVALKQLCQRVCEQDFSKMIKSSAYAEHLSLLADKLRIDAEFAKTLFKPVTEDIVSHVRSIISSPTVEGLDMIVMVGGFSECRMTYDAIKAAFPDIKVMVPDGAGLAVLRGAVLYGHMPESITSRIMKYTYGTRTTPIFDPDIHKPDFKVVIEGKTRCANVFQPIVKAGQSVSVGHKEMGRYHTLLKKQNVVDIEIFVSSDESPMYVTDENVKELGKMEIEIPNQTDKERVVRVYYVFGDTELQMVAMEEETAIPYISHFNII